MNNDEMQAESAATLEGGLFRLPSDQPEMEMEMETETTDPAQHRRHLEELDNQDRQQYLQAPQISAQDVDDWCCLPELPTRKLGMTQSASNIFRSSFTILHQAWGCSAADCIPGELRLVTPYSLGLVVRLAELALLTECGKDEAHRLLLSTTQDRCSGMACALDTLVATGMERGMPHKRYVEHRVQEYVGGLMIEDVELAKTLFEIIPYKWQEEVPTDNRADRAAKRLNRHGNLPPALEQQASQREAHVGDWGHGTGWANKQQRAMQHQKHQNHRQIQHQHQRQQGPPRTALSQRQRKRRGKILEFQSSARDEERKSIELPAIDDEQMHDSVATDQAFDSTRAPPSSPHQGYTLAQRPKRSKESRENKRIRANDRKVVRMFNEMSMDEDGVRRGKSNQDPAVFKEEDSPQHNGDYVMPA